MLGGVQLLIVIESFGLKNHKAKSQPLSPQPQTLSLQQVLQSAMLFDPSVLSSVPTGTLAQGRMLGIGRGVF